MDDGVKGKRGRPVWTFIKNASFAMTLIMFIFTTVLVLDAYKFVSVRHAKFARKKLLRTLRHMDPSIIEAHTGMKVLTIEEYQNLTSTLEKARADVRDMNLKVQEKFSEVLQAAMSVQNLKQDIEDLKKLVAEKETADNAAKETAAKEAEAAPAEEAAEPADEAAPAAEGEVKETPAE